MQDVYIGSRVRNEGVYLVAFSFEFRQQLMQQQHLARGLHQQVQL